MQHSKLHRNPAMSTPHRATPEQWAEIEGESWNSPRCSTILELRARVEALEATQHAHADVSRLSDAEQDRLAQELAKPAAWRPLDIETTYGSEHAADAAQILNPRMVVEGTFEHGGETYRFKARPKAAAVKESLTAPPAPTTEARPAERLWERMEDAGRRELDDNPHAEQAEFYQAMLREVAQTLRASFFEHAADWLEQEADRG
jgi:hypothetical protein